MKKKISKIIDGKDGDTVAFVLILILDPLKLKKLFRFSGICRFSALEIDLIK